MLANVAIYARSSCDCAASAEDQIDGLRTVAADHGWTVSMMFTDRPMSIKKRRERRPGEDALMNAIKTGGVQKVLLWSVDRVGRSLVELVRFIETCRIAGVSGYVHDQNL